ncbi:TPM domain-containing protein [Erythrobacter sp. HA6-11]
MLRAFLTGLAALVLAGACAAEPPPEAEAHLELTGRVVDAADIFEPQFEAELTQTLAELEEDTLIQLVVATTPSLEGHDIADYSRELGNAWGIGDAERNDGLLMLVAPNERKVRIAVGFGLESVVTNTEASAIIEELILPHFRESNYETGVAAGVEGLIEEVTPAQLKEAA